MWKCHHHDHAFNPRIHFIIHHDHAFNPRIHFIIHRSLSQFMILKAKYLFSDRFVFCVNHLAINSQCYKHDRMRCVNNRANRANRSCVNNRANRTCYFSTAECAMVSVFSLLLHTPYSDRMYIWSRLQIGIWKSLECEM